MKKIAVFGAGGFGREVEMLIRQINSVKPEYEFIGYFDDSIEKGELINNKEILGGLSTLNNWETELYLVVAIGDPITKEAIVNQLSNDLILYPVLIHPNVIKGDFVEIGEGSIICAGNIITENIKIGKHVIVNLSCTIGHDALIGDFCSFMPTVNVSGETNIEKLVFVGTGARIINQKKIGHGSIIGAGTVVIKDVPPYSTVVGNPGKVIKTNSPK